MSKQTQKSNFPSIYSPGKFVTFAQYIAELMCGRRGKFENTDLPIQFWESSPKWRKYYQYQVTKVAELQKKFDDNVILTAIKELPTIFSLRSPALLKKMVEVSKRTVIEKEVDIVPAEEASKGRFNRKNRLSNLDD